MKSSHLAITVLTLFLGALCHFVEPGWIADLESESLDWRLQHRYNRNGHEPLDERILIVALDNQTQKLMGKPLSFWGEDLALLFTGLLQSGAQVVGVDILLEDWDTLANPGQQTEFEQSVFEELNRQTTVLAGVLLSGQVVMSDYLKTQGDELVSSGGLSPLEVVVLNAPDGGFNLGAANVITDTDGSIRRLPMIFAELNGKMRSRGLAPRLAEFAEGKPLLKAGSVVKWNERTIPTEDQGQALRINYPGPGEPFPVVSASELFASFRKGQEAPELKDKLVIVAPTVDSWQDFRDTPYDTNTPGYKIHASVLNQLLTQRFITRGTDWAFLLPLLLVGLVSVGLRPRVSLPVASGLILVYIFAAFEVFAATNVWLRLVAPLMAMVAAFLAGYAVRLMTVEKQSRVVRGALTSMVGPAIARHVTEDSAGLRLEGAHQRITVLFCDISNFTPACEGSTPEQVIHRLNNYFEEMVQLVIDNGGALKQFVGDELMALFGAPQELENQAACAVNTGMQMIARLAELKEQDPESKHGFYDVKIGIHTGDVVIGGVGSSVRWEYTAVGDNVNTAARVMSLKSELGESLLVSEVSKAEAEKSLKGVVWRDHGPRSFKGKKNKLSVYTPEYEETPKS